MDWPQDAAMSAVVETVSGAIVLPEVGIVRRTDAIPSLADVGAATRAETRAVLSAWSGSPGSVAVGIGSRGIDNLLTIATVVVEELQAAGWRPFIVPAMGSHGGGTAEGQLEVLASYGISEDSLAVPVRATMETTVVGDIAGVPIHLDRHVAEAGRFFLVARVKPHTDFHGTIESGVTKMAAIGLGKQAGARAIHGSGVHGLRDVMPAAGRAVVDRFALGAIAVVENERHRTASVSGLTPADIGGAKEMALLVTARAGVAPLPFGELDVLIVDRIGKDISGVGMDPNVTGRWLVTGMTEPTPPPVRCIVALDLTDASHGNAIGVGLADFVPRRLVQKIDLASMYINACTAGWVTLSRSRLPMAFDTDADAIRVAASVGARVGGAPLRLAWITDTLHGDILAVSPALWAEAAERTNLERVGGLFPLPFDVGGRLEPLATRTGGG
jgi:hypothetical protein